MNDNNESNNNVTHPLVSIIIPTKNSKRTISSCLESIKQQTYENIEIIIIDGMSSDNTTKLSSTYTKKIFSLNCERAKAKNFGITKSQGKFLFFIDSDMKLDKQVVEECVKKFQENEKLGGIIIPERSFGSCFWVKVRDFERQFYAGTKVASARFFPIKLVSLVNGFDEKIISYEESVLPQKIEKLGNKVDEMIQSYIHHDEEGFSLLKWLKKKHYYALTEQDYVKKYGKYANLQFSITYRTKIFFANGKWKILMKHPAMTLGLFTLKGLEFFSRKI